MKATSAEQKLKPGASNAPAGYPTHSPNGYPLFYGISGEGKVVGEPRLQHDSQTFANEAEIADYDRRVASRAAALAEFQATWAMNQTILAPGAFDIRNGTTEDALFEWYFTFELAPFGLVGPMEAIHRLHTWIDSGAEDTNPEFPSMNMGGGNRQLARGGWDWSTYQGPLRAILEAHRGAPL